MWIVNLLTVSCCHYQLSLRYLERAQVSLFPGLSFLTLQLRTPGKEMRPEQSLLFNREKLFLLKILSLLLGLGRLRGTYPLSKLPLILPIPSPHTSTRLSKPMRSPGELHLSMIFNLLLQYHHVEAGSDNCKGTRLGKLLFPLPVGFADDFHLS